MCLAIPGRVIEWLDRTQPFSKALVEFDGVRREVAMGCVPHTNVGEYVIVHAGVAISQMSEGDAEQLLAELRQMNALGQGSEDSR